MKRLSPFQRPGSRVDIDLEAFFGVAPVDSKEENGGTSRSINTAPPSSASSKGKAKTRVETKTEPTKRCDKKLDQNGADMIALLDNYRKKFFNESDGTLSTAEDDWDYQLMPEPITSPNTQTKSKMTAGILSRATSMRRLDNSDATPLSPSRNLSGGRVKRAVSRRRLDEIIREPLSPTKSAAGRLLRYASTRRLEREEDKSSSKNVAAAAPAKSMTISKTKNGSNTHWVSSSDDQKKHIQLNICELSK